MNKITIIAAVAASMTLASCSGFLEDAPKLKQSTEITLSSYEGLNKAVQAAYGPLYSTNWYGADYVLAAEMRSGNGWRKASGNFQSGRYVREYNWNYSSDNTSGLWGTAYYLISAVNNVLENLDGKQGGGVTQQDLDNLKAECLFLRALAHFDLVRLYAQPYSYQPDGLGIPIVLKTDPAGKPARDTTSKVYAQIVKDLLEAEECIDETYNVSSDYWRDGADHYAYASIYAIQALLARVYANMEDWTNTQKYASKVIDSGKFRLWTREEYPEMWWQLKPIENGEVIFEVYGDKNNSYYGGYEQIEYVTNPEGYADCAMSDDILSILKENENDIRAAEDTMIRTDAMGASGIKWTCKYFGKTGSKPDYANVIVLRLSEMYLLRAEAAYHLSQFTSATNDFNAVTVARGNEAKSSVGLPDIKNEFRKEFVYEGHYFFDLARWQQKVERTDFSGDPLYQNISFPNFRWALPLSKSELEVNGNLVQNEGWY